MIIKSKPVQSGDGAQITNYVLQHSDNENVVVLRESNSQLLVADDFALLRGRKSGLIHITISPGDKALTLAELNRTLDAIRTEFGFNTNDPETLVMHESKRANGASQKHYHYIRPAADTKTGRTYKLFRSKCKDEFVSRLMEFELGHRLILGKHNNFVKKRLQEMGRDGYADQLAATFGSEDQPQAAFSSRHQHQAKRQGCDLPKLSQKVKEIARLPFDQQPRKLAEMIHQQGLGLEKPVEVGRGRSRINLVLGENIKHFNANRVLKIKAADVAAFIYTAMENLNALKFDAGETGSGLNKEPSIKNNRGAEPNPSKQQTDHQASERVVENTTSSSEELEGEAFELAQAAKELRSQVVHFISSRVTEQVNLEFEAAPDFEDPNLMKKLSAMLRRQIQKATAALKATMGEPTFASDSQ